ncbi:MAG: S8 family serine peptidase [Rhizobiaceae bacterium]
MSVPSMQGEFTGRLLVVGKPKKGKDTISAIKDATGLSIASSRDFKDQAVGVEALESSDGVYFDEIGIAVITPKAEDHFSKLAGSSALASGDDEYPIVEPERIVHALDENFGDYLRGFRDAINTVTDKYSGIADAYDDQAMLMDAPSILANGSTWGLQSTNVVTGMPFMQTRTGAGIKIAVLDTGMDLNHPDFAGRTIVSQSFVPGEAVQDGHSHGTHCIGIACGPLNPTDPNQPRYGVAHACDIYVGKVLSNAGSGADGWILGGINWAIAQGCEVISMSLGARTSQDGFSAAYENAAQAALNAGTLIIAAAGNDFSQPVSHPANCPSIMAVGAVGPNHVKADFSNVTFFSPHGSVDIAGPGVGTLSSVPVSMGSYDSKSGTSMATPHVAGIAALHAQRNASYRGAALWQRLTATALGLPSEPSTHVGSGLVQAPFRRIRFDWPPVHHPWPPVFKHPGFPIDSPVRPIQPVPGMRARAK